MQIREIRREDDAAIAEIIRYNLKKHGLAEYCGLENCAELQKLLFKSGSTYV